MVMIRPNISLPQDLHRKIKVEAAKLDLTINDYIQLALMKALKDGVS